MSLSVKPLYLLLHIMNEQNKDLILFKKLVKVVEEFLKSHYFKSYGH